MSAQPQPVALIPRCVGCGEMWLPTDSDHWQARWAVDAPQEDLLFYCPTCAKRESE